MTYFLIVGAVVVLTCIASSKILYRFGVPALLIFLSLGMLFGTDGIGGIYFEDYSLSEGVATLGLSFILFYGGFSTNWKTARPTAVPASVLASLGTVLTAALTGFFCYFILDASLAESLLIGAILSSTDAASVFSILRSRKLGLKDGLAPMLEIESGGNDPFANILTVVMLAVITSSDTSLFTLISEQLLFGIGLGIILALSSAAILRHVSFDIEGMYPIFLTAVVVLGYALSCVVGGNEFICVYIMGILLGNSRIPHKKSLVHFFDAVSWMMQIMLFFILGLLSTPSSIGGILLPGVLIAISITFVARPIAVFVILSLFRMPIKDQIFVSWVGLRGSASIAFAIIAVTRAGDLLAYDIYHLVFLVAILSVLLQGSLMPMLAKKLQLMEDDETAVFKTFTDYTEDTHTKLIEFKVEPGNPLAGLMIMDANIPEEILVVMIKRGGGEVVVPKGSTVILAGDILVLSGDSFENVDYLKRDVIAK